MTPIEAMAKAYMQADYDWVVATLKSSGLAGTLDTDSKPARVSSAMRAALSALAECEIPDSILKMGMARYYQGPENDEAAAFGGGVQAILRALIEESK